MMISDKWSPLCPIHSSSCLSLREGLQQESERSNFPTKSMRDLGIPRQYSSGTAETDYGTKEKCLSLSSEKPLHSVPWT